MGDLDGDITTYEIQIEVLVVLEEPFLFDLVILIDRLYRLFSNACFSHPCRIEHFCLMCQSMRYGPSKVQKVIP
jgi:hypothetical protein